MIEDGYRKYSRTPAVLGVYMFRRIRRHIILSSAIILLFGTAGCSLANEVDSNQGKAMFPDAGVWGMVIHYPYRSGIKEIGSQWVRLSIRWKDEETIARGSYNWVNPDKLISHYLDKGFKVMAILTLEDISPLYEVDKGNQKLVIDAIAKLCGAVAGRYKGKGILWELSNEPEVFPMGGYWNVPETYTRMARKAAKAIKAADPTAKVGAISMAWVDRDFMSRCMKAGLLSDGTINVVTYHGYHRHNLMADSGLAEDVAWMRQVIAENAPKGKQIIIADSERGYARLPFLTPKPTGNWRNQVYTESEQAAYLARHYFETIYLGVEIAAWYKDMFGEDEFSVYYSDQNDPKGLRPMGHVYRNMADLLPENPTKLKNDKYSVL